MGTVNTNLRTKIADDLATVFEAVGAVLEIGTTAWAATLATWDFSTTQAAASAGVWTFTFDSNDATVGGGGGTASIWRMKDAASPTYEIDGGAGSVSTSGADINFDSVTWSAGQTATITSMTLTVPAATA